MDTLFAARTTYDEKLYYNQVLASKKAAPVVKKEKKFNFPAVNGRDMVLGVLAFVVFFVTLDSGDVEMRVFQSVLMSIVFVYVMGKINGNRKKDNAKSSDGKKDAGKQNADAADHEQARALLENSGLSGVRCNVTFGEDGFQVENPGIVTMYKYEGIAWIKETADYYMIFWNRSLAIPVEKAGFYKGKQEQFGKFLEKKCQKTIEKVRNAG